MKKDPASAPSPDLAARLAREAFGLDGTASPLPGEYDDNFRLDESDGRSFVLKLMHPQRDAAFGFETNINNGHVIFDGSDRAFDDPAFKALISEANTSRWPSQR